MINYAENGYNLITNSFVSILNIIVIYKFMYAFLSTRNVNLFLKATIFATTFVLLLISFSFYNPLYEIIISLISIILFTSVYFESNKSNLIALSMLLLFAEFALNFLIAFIIMMCINYTLGHIFSITFLLSLFAILIIIQLFKNYISIRTNVKYPLKYLLYLSITPLISILIINNIFLFDSNGSNINNFFSIFTIILFIFLNIIVFKIFETLIEDGEAKKQNALLRQQMQLYSTYTKEREADNLMIRKTQHDLKNHLLNLKALLTSNQTAQTLAQINYLLEENLNFAPTILCGNMVIDTILNNKIKYAESLDIKIIYQIEVPENIPYDTADICIAIGNALDNAIDACSKLQPKKDINLFIKYIHQNLIIRVCNPFDGVIHVDKFNNIESTKKDIVNHGFGISAIEKIADKYNGVLNIQFDMNLFDLKLLLLSKD